MTTSVKTALWQWAPAASVAVAAVVLWTSAVPRLTVAAGAVGRDEVVAPAAVPARPVDPAALLDGVRSASVRVGVTLERWRPVAAVDGAGSQYEAVVQGRYPDVGRFVEAVEARVAVMAVDVRAVDDSGPVVEAVVTLSDTPPRP